MTKNTKVIFRKFKDGEIVALFPEMQADESRDHCGSYMHIGQHGAASYRIVDDTTLAKEDDYRALKTELEEIGYILDVGKRVSNRWFNIKED